MTRTQFSLQTWADTLYYGVHGDISKPIDNWKETLRLIPESHPEVSHYEYNLGQALLRRAYDGDVDDAIYHFRKAVGYLESSKSPPDYFNVLGLVLRNRNGAGDLDESVDCHRRAIELIHEDSEHLHVDEHNLGDALLTRRAEGDVQEAIDHFLEAS